MIEENDKPDEKLLMGQAGGQYNKLRSTLISKREIPKEKRSGQEGCKADNYIWN